MRPPQTKNRREGFPFSCPPPLQAPLLDTNRRESTNWWASRCGRTTKQPLASWHARPPPPALVARNATTPARRAASRLSHTELNRASASWRLMLRVYQGSSRMPFSSKETNLALKAVPSADGRGPAAADLWLCAAIRKRGSEHALPRRIPGWDRRCGITARGTAVGGGHAGWPPP
jgi:hypothetical protein